MFLVHKKKKVKVLHVTLTSYYIVLVLMLSTALAQGTTLAELSSSRTPFPHKVGYKRDCSLGRRIYAANALERVRTANDLQISFVLDALNEEGLAEIESENTLQYLMEHVQSSSSDDDMSLSGDDSDTVGIEEDLPEAKNAEDDLATFFLARATDDLERLQPESNNAPMPKFDNSIDRYSEEECQTHFHLSKDKLEQLFRAWNVPATFKTSGNGSKWTGEAAFLMYLRRTCNIIKYTDKSIQLEMGGRHPSAMCEIVKQFQAWLFAKFRGLLDGNLNRWNTEVWNWYEMIKSKVGQYNEQWFGKVCMFIDGTFTPVSRPSGWSYLQRVLWTRYKKSHGLAFLAIVAPNGLAIYFSPPAPGRHNDNWMVNENRVTESLRSLFNLCDPDGNLLRCYGDLIFAHGPEISRGHKDNPTLEELVENGQMNVCSRSIYFILFYFILLL